MKKTLTKNEVRELHLSIISLSQSEKPLNLSSKVWYALSKNKKKLQSEIESIEDVRKSLAKDIFGKEYFTAEEAEAFKQEDMDKYTKEFNNLMSSESELEFHMINISDMPDDLPSAPGVMAVFDHLITE